MHSNKQPDRAHKTTQTCFPGYVTRKDRITIPILVVMLISKHKKCNIGLLTFNLHKFSYNMNETSSAIKDVGKILEP